MGSPAIVSLWDRLPPSVQAVNPHLRPKAARTPRLSVMAQHAAAGAPEHAAEIVDSHARRDRARATSRTAQAAGGGFEAWCDAQHGAARALGWLVWVDHYGPAVQFLGGGGARGVQGVGGDGRRGGGACQSVRRRACGPVAGAREPGRANTHAGASAGAAGHPGGGAGHPCPGCALSGTWECRVCGGTGRVAHV